jgi:hypothetical protein
VRVQHGGRLRTAVAHEVPPPSYGASRASA